MKGPNFVLIGAMKCGTSTLAAQLGAQDGIFLTDPKEPNYFSDDAVFARGPDWYASLFDAAAADDIRGEASTHYTKLPDLPDALPRMRAALDQVRLVYMIRDPMARLVSHYVHAWSEKVVAHPLPQAIERHAPLVDYGLYAMQIAPWIEAWGAEAVLLTSLERMRGDPAGELARVAAHVGHDGPVAWAEDLSTENVSAERARPLPFHDLIDSQVGRVLRRTLVPKALRQRVYDARKMKERPAIPADKVAALRAHFLSDRAELARLFPGDPSLDLAYPWAVEAEA